MLNAFLLCNVQNYLCILNKKHISHSHILGQTQMVLVSYKGISCMSELSTRLWIAIILLLYTDSSHEEQTVYPPPPWFFHLAHFIKIFMSLFKLLIFFHYFSWEVKTRSSTKTLDYFSFLRCSQHVCGKIWISLDLFTPCFRVAGKSHIFFKTYWKNSNYLITQVSIWNPSCCLTAAVQVSCTLAFLPSGCTAPEARWGGRDWQSTSGKNACAVSENSNAFFFPALIQCFFRNVGVLVLKYISDPGTKDDAHAQLLLKKSAVIAFFFVFSSCLCIRSPTSTVLIFQTVWFWITNTLPMLMLTCGSLKLGSRCWTSKLVFCLHLCQ